jgi:hypothetical protein
MVRFREEGLCAVQDGQVFCVSSKPTALSWITYDHELTFSCMNDAPFEATIVVLVPVLVPFLIAMLVLADVLVTAVVPIDVPTRPKIDSQIL